MVTKQVKRQIMKGIDKDKLVQLTFSLSDAETLLHWKHSKEFEYNEQMYDVVHKEITGDTIVFHCWWDNKETMLNQQLKSLVINVFSNNAAKEKTQNQLVHVVKNQFFYDVCNELVLSPELGSISFVPTTNLYSSYSIPPGTPPPRKG